MATIQSQSTSNLSSIAQWESVEALNGLQEFIPENNKVFKERRDFVVSMLNQATGSTARARRVHSTSIRPAPALSAQPALPAIKLETDEDFVTELLESEGVAVVQGSAFGLGPAFPHLLRDQKPRISKSA